MSRYPSNVVIREVGLRDGLQSIQTILPTERKQEWIRDAYDAGQREIEVGSFVPARLLPQLADTAEVLAYAKTLPGLFASVLVPNLKGAERAIEAKADLLLVPLSASHEHSLANLRKTPDEVIAEVGRIRALRDAAGSKTLIEGGIGTAFGCTIQGRVEPSEVLRCLQGLLDAGADRVSIADTVGYADPAMVRDLFEQAVRIAGDRFWCGHFHDTRGLALANVYAALEVGVDRFDATLAGIGGCPHAPGASGNASSEDLAFMLASMGIDTGIDIERLLALRAKVAGWLEDETLHGTLWLAGFPRGFAPRKAVGRTYAPPSPSPLPPAGEDSSKTDEAALPLAGLRVIEFTHMVMGPTCGMILADLGAEVIKIEPPGGDKTRKLPGLGIGFFRSFNRNKKSVVLDINSPEGHATVLELIGQCDVMLENFRPGLMTKLGLDYAALSQRFPRLIYVSHKGFLPGPYEHRLALDEVVQMMGGLSYMTGPKGRPLRAGTSVNDIMGGMFGAIGVLAALRERDRTGRGQEVQSALFENCAFLSAQHIQQYSMTGEPPPPMPSRVSAWSVYDVFTLAGGEQLFIGAVSDKQFLTLCRVIESPELAEDPGLATNAQRVAVRPELLRRLGEILKHHRIDELSQKLEAAGLPYAPIVRPEQLLDDPHLKQSGGLVPMQTDDGSTTDVVLLPLTLGGRRPGVRQPLARAGEHTDEILSRLSKRAA
jgi:crotonobetainyl-CoA:carnitine CoA-transferase CaiB-like acyl-CoA transferase